MQEKFHSLETALNHLELRILLHQRALAKYPDHYSDSFKNGQNLIFKDFFPELEVVRKELEKIKKGDLHCQSN